MRCEADLVIGPHATNKRFCSSECYHAWWKEHHFVGMTVAERSVKSLGPAPAFVLSDVQAAWLACAIDGEGSIGIWRGPRRTASESKYRVAVVVTNTNLDFIAQVSGLVSGRVTVKQMPRKPHHRQCYAVRLSARATLPLLEQVRPYLVIKGKQADLVMQFCRAVNASLVQQADHELYEHFYLECRDLNKRGA